MYHDFLGREIEDLEGDNMRRDAREEARIKRVRIQATNDLSRLSLSETEYRSDEMPLTFERLRSIVEEDDFENMTITINGIQYLITLAKDSEQVTPTIDAIEHYHAIETAINLLQANVTNLRTALLIIKATLHRVS